MSEQSPSGEPLKVPLSEEESRRWKSEMLRPDADIWALLGTVLKKGVATSPLHPSDQTGRIARFIGRGAPPDGEGIYTQLPILAGKYFEITFTMVEGRITDIRSLSFVTPREERAPVSYGVDFRSDVPRMREHPPRTLEHRLLQPLTAEDAISFGATVSALWDENVSGNIVE